MRSQLTLWSADHDDFPELAEGAATSIRRLPADWNASGDMFSFRYKHSQSSLTFLLKGVKIGKNKLVVHGMGIEDEQLHSVELAPSTFVSSNCSFPAQPSEGSALEGAFASREQLHAVLREFRVGIMQKLIPGLNKPGYEPAG